MARPRPTYPATYYVCQTWRFANVFVRRQSHTGFRLVQTSMTLNDFKLRNSPYFTFFLPNSTDFQAYYVTVVVDRPI